MADPVVFITSDKDAAAVNSVVDGEVRKKTASSLDCFFHAESFALHMLGLWASAMVVIASPERSWE
jgi:hypothetical protein